MADVNAVPPPGVDGMELFMDGAPLPGCKALGVGPLAIGDVKYKTESGLFKRMLIRKPVALRLPRCFRAGADADQLRATVLIAALSGRGLAASARRAGYAPLVADVFGDTDTPELAAGRALRGRGAHRLAPSRCRRARRPRARRPLRRSASSSAPDSRIPQAHRRAARRIA